MPAASDNSSAPALAPARTSASPPNTSRLPASLAGAFAAAAYSLQSELATGHTQDTEPEADKGLLPKLYASRLGKPSRDYYLRQFQRFDALNRGLPSWNIAAACFTLAWCSLRGLWREAACYLLAVLASAALWWWGMRPLMPSAMAYGLAAALCLLAMAIPGLMGNSWYWRKVRTQTLQAVNRSATMAQAHSQLAALAITPRQQALALLVLALPLAAAAGASLALLPEKITAAPTPKAATIEQAPSTALSTASTATTATPAATASADKSVSQPSTDAATQASKAAPEGPTSLPSGSNETSETTQAPQGVASEKAGLEAGQFYVNVGVFSDPERVHQVLALLEKSRLPALTQALPSNKGEITRIRTGPFESQKLARKAARKLRPLQLESTVFQADKKPE